MVSVIQFHLFTRRGLEEGESSMLTLLASWLLCSWSQSVPCGALTELDAWGTGLLDEMAISGQTAFVNSGDTLSVIDLTDPEHGVIVHSEPSSFMTQLLCHGNELYAVHQNEIDIFRVGASYELTLLHTITIPSAPYVQHIAFCDDLLFVAWSSLGLRVFDVSDPQHPDPVDTFEPGGSVGFVAVSDTMVVAYDSTSDRLHLLNPDPSLSPLGFIDASFTAAYPSTPYLFTLTPSGTIRSYDISDPSTPILLDTETTGQSGSNPLKSVLHDQRLYFLRDSGIYFTDVSNPLDLPWAESVRGLTDGTRILISDSRIYASSPTDGIIVVDMPSHSLRGRFNQYLSAGQMRVSDNHIYVGGSHGLRVFQWDGAHLEPLAWIAGEPLSGMIHLDGDTLFAAYIGTSVFDVSDPADPLLQGTITTLRTIDGTYGYMHYYGATSGFDVWNLTDPLDPQPLGSLSSSSSLSGTSYCLGDFVYITGNSGWMRIVDVSDKNNPFLVTLSGTQNFGYAGSDLTFFGSHGYLATGDDIEILFMAGPATRKLGTMPTMGPPMVLGDRLVGFDYDKTKFFGLDNPSVPDYQFEIPAGLAEPWDAICVQDDLVFNAGGRLHVYQFEFTTLDDVMISAAAWPGISTLDLLRQMASICPPL